VRARIPGFVELGLTYLLLTLSGYGADANELISDRPVSLDRGLVLDGCHVVWPRVTPNPPLPRF
jgi:amylosucrase